MTLHMLTSKIVRLFYLFSFLSVNIGLLHAANPKHIAVPPDKIDQQKLLRAADKGVFSHSTMLPINFSKAKTTKLSNASYLQEIEQVIFFDQPQNGPIMFIGPDSKNWQVTVINAKGQEIINERANDHSRLPTQMLNVGEQAFEGKQLNMTNAVSESYKIKLYREVESTKFRAQRSSASSLPDGYVLYKGDPQFKVYSYLNHNMTIQNQPISIVAYTLQSLDLEGARTNHTNHSPLTSSITTATALITTPSKQQISLVLEDNGLNGDQIAGDGKYSSKIPTNEIGVYTSQVQIEGIRPDGIRFTRTVTDLYPIEKQNYQLRSTRANLTFTTQNRATLSIPVKSWQNAKPVYLSAEVWGTNQNGEKQVAAWIGGVVAPSESNSETTLNIGFDTRWLTRNKLTKPLALKSVRLQSLDSHTPVAQLNFLKIDLSSSAQKELNQRLLANTKAPSESAQTLDISAEMLMGNAPLDSKAKIKASNSPKLLLVHGYCSSGNTWQTSSFSNSALFNDLNQNRSHEEFATRLLNDGAAYSSFGVVAHSQGGAAALHLYSRYWSGLDNATGGRLIQSVGTPYRGTALTGNIAALGDIFGQGCGANTDLTYSGAANWLATIPSWARSQVDYYTTSFNTKWWRYDYCHLASDLFLDDPEDGTTEKWSGQLSGAVNKGHKKGWCHTSGMRDPAQYRDSSRNSSMNARAAR